MSSFAVLAGSAHPELARTVADRAGAPFLDCSARRFPDSELHIEIPGHIRGQDVYLIQPTSPPVNDHLVELLLLTDACRRAGAGRVTAVVPYFGYARQDRRASGREPVSARLVSDCLRAAGADRMIVIDAHTPAIEGFFGPGLEHLTAVRLLADAVQAPQDGVVVAPDLGAVRLAERYAAAFRLPTAIVRKVRAPSGEVTVHSIIGEVEGRIPIIVDDMISTGATIGAAVAALTSAGARQEAIVLTTHAPLVGPAIGRLSSLPLHTIVCTDSIALPTAVPLPLRVVSVAPLLAEAVHRLHQDESLAGLRIRR